MLALQVKGHILSQYAVCPRRLYALWKNRSMTASCLAQCLGVPECKKMNAAAVRGEQE